MIKKIGTFSVDAGLLWIGDPGYVWPTDPKDRPNAAEREVGTWQAFCSKLNFEQGFTSFGGLGVAVNTGGDGSFPVYATFVKGVGITSITIDLEHFDDEEPNE